MHEVPRSRQTRLLSNPVRRILEVRGVCTSSARPPATNLPFHSGPASARCEGEIARSTARGCVLPPPPAGYSRNSLPRDPRAAAAALRLAIDVLLVCCAHASRPHSLVFLVQDETILHKYLNRL
ncbi:hypothetical protein EVAR_65336_1 [Eumeta japonica]|uniref:Uncharacterized protein n=1 Tax=Eumeta variegata TaxID=151549 RepID=A0A4C1YRE9_EUMVA|nr:hypothetical protein EVAR_65336_1 [Eumeta japonica]